MNKHYKNIYRLKQIETPRLLIRPVQLGDEYPLNVAVNNTVDLLQKWQPWANDPSIEATRGFIQQGVFSWESGSVVNFPMVVIHKIDQKIIAATGYNERSDIDKGLYEIGYWCDKDYQGKGYVTEYANALTRYAFDALNATKVVISMDSANIKSIAVALRLNFSLDQEWLESKPTQYEKNAIYTIKSTDKLPDLDFSYTSTDHNTGDHQLISWAKDVLKITDNNAFSTSKSRVKTPWSTVIEINTGNEVVYLKQTPQDLLLEADIIHLLRSNCGIQNIPEIMSTNSTYRCFMMKKCGDLTLRDFFTGTLNIDILINAVEGYKKLQKSTTPVIDDLIALGVPDWRLNKFSTLYNELVFDTDFLRKNGLDTHQQSLLGCYSTNVKELCDKLTNYGISECLNHSDFHDNNIVYDKTTKTTAIIDLGETAINHPFFSIASLLNDTKSRYNIEPHSTDFLKLKQACYSNWLKSENELPIVIHFIEQLLPVYLLFAHMRFVNATCPVELAKISRMKDRVQKAFIWFIHNMEATNGE